jgi:crotonobetainyl-CoA:carnitine CoA-transferase CaiB-like acyl-CoA transferase
MTGALAGVRVLDLTAGVAGPMAAMLLADFGADVVKVECPAGDPGRSRPGFALWNRNKRAVVVDADTPAGQAELRHLLRCADVCMTSDGAGSVGGGAAVAEAVTANPALVLVQLPAFLGTPRWPGGAESAGMLLALTGLSLRQSSTDGGPVESVFPYILYLQAVLGAIATVAALIERHRLGYGQTVLAGGVHAAMVAATSAFVIDPDVPEAPADFGPAGPNAMYSWYRCLDGAFVFMATLTPKFEHAAIEVLGLADVLTDARILGEFDAMLRPENRGWVRDRFEQAFAARTSEDWLRRFRDADVPAGLVAERDAWWSSPIIDSLGMRARLDDPERGPVIMPANPVNLTASPASIDRPAPRLGEHTGQLGDWTPIPVASRPPAGSAHSGGSSGAGPTAAALPAGDSPAADTPPEGPSAGGPLAGGPLAGFRVLDLGAILAGPFAGTLLADLGADVIKVEVPAGDSWRQRGMPFIRGQRGLAIDLRAADGLDAFLRLTRSADVVLDNYRAGVLERLRIDYDCLRAVNPDIISVSITGYGHDPAYSAEPAFDALMQAKSGMLAAQGGPAGPVLTSVPINDVTSAALAVLGTVLALLHRQRTGQGQYAWLALAATAALAQAEELVQFTGRAPAPRGELDYRGAAPLDRCYATSDGWLRLEAPGELGTEALRLAGLLTGSPEASPDELQRQLASEFAAMNRDDAVRRLRAAGLPAVPVRRLAEVTDDADYARWETFSAMDRAPRPPLLVPGRYFWFSRTRNRRVLTPPGVGEHTAEVLAEAGYDDGRIAELAAAGVVRLGTPMVHRMLPVYR